MPVRIQPLFTFSQGEDIFPIFAVDPRSAHLFEPSMSNRIEKLN